ncbi:MAG: endonuclease III [Proteobacteria bacterium]|nr:endonuclease III [Pseudomonadota bacterium]
MKKSERAQRIGHILDELFPAPEVPLSHRDPFSLLVAVVLSAQCTDARVNLITPHLFAAYPDMRALAAAQVPQVREIIRSCGLSNTKAAALVGLSQQILAHHDGRVPDTFEALEALPGVGHKTASVVMSQAFGVPAFPVDTHIHRCAHRWKLSNGRSVVQTERDLKKLYPQSQWNRLHLQIIYFARQYCPARGHDPEACPICSWV